MRKLLIFVFALTLLAYPACSEISGLDPVIKNDLIKVGSDVIVPPLSSVQSAISVGGNVDVAGTVEKDVVAVGGNVIIRKTAAIKGDAVAIGGKIIKDTGAKISGNTVEVGLLTLPGVFVGKDMAWGLPIIGLLSFAAFLVLALFTVALFPRQIGRVSYNCERRTGPAFLWGLLMIILIIPIIVLLAVSLIGIAFIPAYLIILAAAVFFGYVAISQLLGKNLLKSMKLRNKPMMLEVAIGIFSLALIGLIPIVGGLIKILAATIGLGAVFATRFGITD